MADAEKVHLADLYHAAIALEGVAYPYCSRQRSVWKRAHKRLDAIVPTLFSRELDDSWLLKVSAFWTTYRTHLKDGEAERARKLASTLVKDVREEIQDLTLWRQEGASYNEDL